MPGGRRSYSNGMNQPTREVCPCCGKKGLGVWHRITIDFETHARKVRQCRYCNHKQIEMWNSSAPGTTYGGYVRVEG